MKPESREKAKKALIVEALELSPSAREAFLDAQCFDPTLRAEINSVLRAYDVAVQFPDQRPQLGDLDTAADVPFGSYIGQYIVIDRLDSGGQGEVFLGNDPLLHRKVALKRLISPNPGSSDEWARILREARAAARISHPNVATIHTVIEHATRAFIVMEYVEGENLAARMRRERLPVQRVIEIGHQLASALAAAHAKGVIHRDLKPKNVQLTLDGSAKVLDFGVASATPLTLSAVAMNGSGVETQTATLRGGTPGYMSPEQMLGRRVDERSDIFGLGIVLFEMATGQRLYPSTEIQNLTAAMSQPARRADAVDPNVPRRLADLIAKALELDRVRRFQSARDFDRELQASLTPAGAQSLSVGLVSSLWLAAAFITVTLAGAVTSLVYLDTRLRGSNFAQESPLWWPYWGLRSMFLPLGVMVEVAMVYALLNAACRLVLATSLSARRWCERVQASVRTPVDRLRSVPGTAWAQALLFANILTIVLLWWGFNDLINDGIGNLLLQSGRLSMLAPARAAEHRLYRQLLSLELFVFGVAWYRLLKLRYERRERGGLAILACGLAAIAATVVLLAAPYRILYQNVGERVSYDSQPCYLVGERGNDALLFCPRQPPPWNRLVRLDDAALRLGQVSEKNFSEIDRVR